MKEIITMCCIESIKEKFNYILKKLPFLGSVEGQHFLELHNCSEYIPTLIDDYDFLHSNKNIVFDLINNCNTDFDLISGIFNLCKSIDCVVNNKDSNTDIQKTIQELLLELGSLKILIVKAMASIQEEG